MSAIALSSAVELELHPRWLDTTIADVMLQNPITVDVNDSLSAAQLKMSRAAIGHLPVLDHDRPVGMVTARDLARSMLVPLTVLTHPEIEVLLQSPVRWAMSRPLVALPPQTQVRDAVRLMVMEDVGSVAVIDPRDGRLLGLITRSVILKLAARSA